ncbi:fimbrial protein [Achromobacter xylosoxidans]|uniref:fimbrial protein n=1 Tax=Alcaligenes xylosoxydans xylosoxydans TaxID=85698 RepID=UPI0038FCFC36
MFKKTLLATAATAALLGPVAAFAAGDMGQGFINFTGSVTEAPCSILAADSNLAIDLGQVSKNALATADSHGNSVPIEIHMTGCSFAAPSGGAPPPPRRSRSRSPDNPEPTVSCQTPWVTPPTSASSS